jgi:hypothetical protein
MAPSPVSLLSSLSFVLTFESQIPSELTTQRFDAKMEGKLQSVSEQCRVAEKRSVSFAQPSLGSVTRCSTHP